MLDGGDIPIIMNRGIIVGNLESGATEGVEHCWTLCHLLQKQLSTSKGKMEPAQDSLLLYKSAIVGGPVKLIHMDAEGLRG